MKLDITRFNPKETISQTFQLFTDTFQNVKTSSRDDLDVKNITINKQSIVDCVIKYKQLIYKFGEFEPSKAPVVNYRKISHRIIALNYQDDKLLVTIETCNNLVGYEIHNLLLQEKVQSQPTKVQLLPRMMGRLNKNNEFEIIEFIAFDLVLPNPLNNKLIKYANSRTNFK